MHVHRERRLGPVRMSTIVQDSVSTAPTAVKWMSRDSWQDTRNGDERTEGMLSSCGIVDERTRA